MPPPHTWLCRPSRPSISKITSTHTAVRPNPPSQTRGILQVPASPAWPRPAAEGGVRSRPNGGHGLDGESILVLACARVCQPGLSLYVLALASLAGSLVPSLITIVAQLLPFDMRSCDSWLLSRPATTRLMTSWLSTSRGPRSRLRSRRPGSPSRRRKTGAEGGFGNGDCLCLYFIL